MGAWLRFPALDMPPDLESDFDTMLIENPPVVPYRRRVLHTLAALAVFVLLAAASGLVSGDRDGGAPTAAPVNAPVERAAR